MSCPSCQKPAVATAPYQVQNVRSDSTLARPVPSFVPSIYRFRDSEEPPNTFEDADLGLLLARIVGFRFENQLPEIPYLKEVVLNYTMLSDEAYAPFIEYYTPDHTVVISAKQFLKSALAYVKASTIMSDEELFVDQPEAERRALVCLNCPRNLQYVNGHDPKSPTLAQSKFCSLAQGRNTTADGALGICGVCTCLNKCKVHFAKAFVRDSATAQLLAQFDQKYVGRNGQTHICWISKKQ